METKEFGCDTLLNVDSVNIVFDRRSGCPSNIAETLYFDVFVNSYFNPRPFLVFGVSGCIMVSMKHCKTCLCQTVIKIPPGLQRDASDDLIVLRCVREHQSRDPTWTELEVRTELNPKRARLARDRLLARGAIRAKLTWRVNKAENEYVRVALVVV